MVHSQECFLKADLGKTSSRALPVKFNKKSSDPEDWRFGVGIGKPLEQVIKTM